MGPEMFRRTQELTDCLVHRCDIINFSHKMFNPQMQEAECLWIFLCLHEWRRGARVIALLHATDYERLNLKSFLKVHRMFFQELLPYIDFKLISFKKKSKLNRRYLIIKTIDTSLMI